jgi:fluoride exporter
MPIGLAVAVAGAAGALARYLLDFYAGDYLESHHPAYVTFAINVGGSLLLGLLIGMEPPGGVRVVLGVGFLGAFTTFSTLAYQSYHYLDTANYLRAAALPVATVLVGVAAVALGVAVGQRVA